MIGKTTSSEMRYFKGHNGEEIHEDKDNEKIFRENWHKIFKISDEKNQQFDKENDTIVTEHLNQRKHLLQPKQNTDLDNFVIETDQISLKDINDVIKTFKQRAPGEDSIT